jgi:hypothetical protein
VAVTTTSVVAFTTYTEAEQRLLNNLYLHDIDGVWGSMGPANDPLILRLAYKFCDYAEHTADMTELDPSLPPGQYFIGLISVPGWTDNDFLRAGAMIAALSQSTVCSPRAVVVFAEAAVYILNEDGL